MAERKQSFSDISQKSFVFLGAELIFTFNSLICFPFPQRIDTLTLYTVIVSDGV